MALLFAEHSLCEHPLITIQTDLKSTASSSDECCNVCSGRDKVIDLMSLFVASIMVLKSKHIFQSMVFHQLELTHT